MAAKYVRVPMSYGLIASVAPVNGLYMAFVQVMIYFVFGTSRHISMGTFAVISLMVGKVVREKTTVEILPNGEEKVINPQLSELYGNVTNEQVGVTLAFVAGIIQVVMFICRMGAVSSMLSDTMVSGFTCASAYHVAASQLRDVVGLAVPPRSGSYYVFLSIYDVIANLSDVNMSACIISLVSMIVLIMHTAILKPWLGKRSRIPFPTEILVVLVGIAITYLASLNEEPHHITVVGHIPRGVAPISMPAMSLFSVLFVDSFLIGVVSYATALSMALIFARKRKYDVKPNQELLAHGMTNLISAFFSCIPTGASLSRCVVQEAVGGETQIAGVISAILILIVLLWVGPLFELLPKCVLASVIIIALQGLLRQVRELPYYWHLSHWDGIVWAATFLSTLILTISIGLVVGLVASLLSLACQSLRLEAFIMGLLPGTDLYLSMDNFRAVVDVKDIKVIHFVGSVSFGTKRLFRQLMIEVLGFKPGSLARKRNRLRQKGINMNMEGEGINIKVVVLDFSSLTFLDPSGVDAIRHLQDDLHELDLVLLIAEWSGRAYKVITRCDMYEKIDSKFIIFPTVHDAVLYAQKNILLV